MATSARFSCPGCERKNFRSINTVKNHFLKQCHPLRCHICQRAFRDELAIIQHYQKYNKPRGALTNPPNNSQQIPPPTEPSLLTVVAPTLASRCVQTDFPEEVLERSGHGMEILGDHGLSSSLVSVSLMAFEESPVLEPLPGMHTIVSGYPIFLNSLEQSLILRYLRSRCHSWNRLQAENYILGLGPIKNKQFPTKGSIQTYQFRETPRAKQQEAAICQAIAIDCEMVGVGNGRQELAFISAIDFLTGELLISRYVSPSEKVIDWRTKFSGITEGIMTSAIYSGAAFKSWREARDRLWELMDDSTVLVGQSLNYDLEVLGICHAKIVDTAILTAEAVFPSIISTTPLPRRWSLKTLAKDLLGLEIQKDNIGHSALEDAHAARDVAIWCIRNPEELKLWAENARRREEGCKSRKGQQRHGKGKSRGNVPASQSSRIGKNMMLSTTMTDEISWSDLAEDLGWPEGYDPWSD